MSDSDIILFEQYVKFKGIPFEKGMEYLKIMLNSRDFVNPLYKEDTFLNSELVIADFENDKDYIYVSGAYSVKNGEISENRSFMTKLYDKDNSIILVSEIDRLGNIDGNKKYFVIEKFVKKGNLYNRYTMYDDGKTIKEYKKIDMTLDSKVLDAFINGIIKNDKNKKVF